MQTDAASDEVKHERSIQRHRILTALIDAANRPLYQLVTDSISSADMYDWLIETETQAFFGEDGEWFEWNDCSLCKGKCNFSVQTIHNLNSLNDSFCDWNREIQSHFDVEAEMGPDDWDYVRTPGESDSDWLRRSFYSINNEGEDHSAPIMFRVKQIIRHYGRALTQTSTDSYVWYTASGFGERNLEVDACLPTKELADKWRADHLGLISPDEVTEERIEAQITKERH